MHVVVVGGGPAGATAAERLALSGVQTTLVEKDTTRPKPCGGALTWPVLEEFDLPPSLIERTLHTIRLVPPSGRSADIRHVRPVSLVCRERLDSFLRLRAQEAGARMIAGRCAAVYKRGGGNPLEVVLDGRPERLRADVVIAADGANSVVARSLGLARGPRLLAYQERLEMSPAAVALADRVEVHFRAEVSPDFYGWIFPKGDHLCVGTATWTGRRRIRALLGRLKEMCGLEGVRVIRRESAFIPLRARSRLVIGRVLLTGDAGGFVSPISGEGVYFAMKSGQFAASAVLHAMACGRLPEGLRAYETAWLGRFRRLMRGLPLAQRWFYGEDQRRERFVRLSAHSRGEGGPFSSYLGKAVPSLPPWKEIPGTLRNILVLLAAS